MIVDRKELGLIFDWTDEQISQLEAKGLPAHRIGLGGHLKLYDTARVADWRIARAVLLAELRPLWQS